MADKVFIVLKIVKNVGTSVFGVFANRTSAEKCIAHYIEDYYESTGWTRIYPDEDDKEGFVWQEKGDAKITWEITCEVVNKE